MFAFFNTCAEIRILHRRENDIFTNLRDMKVAAVMIMMIILMIIMMRGRTFMA